MKVAIVQSSFIPWRGYFDIIASVDLFVFYDDIQYTRRDWRNRNRIKTSAGLKWITVPVQYKPRGQLIIDTEISEHTQWRLDHFNQWKLHYSKAPYYNDILRLLDKLGQNEDTTISQLNIRLIRAICDYLNIGTTMVNSCDYKLSGSKTARLIDMLRKSGGTSYLSGPSAESYLDGEAFRREGISLYYKTYDYMPYPQQWGPFEGAVTVLDLIANCGPAARGFIRSRTPDRVVVP